MMHNYLCIHSRNFEDRILFFESENVFVDFDDLEILVTHQPQDYFDCLFEPDDIVEIRIIPPKGTSPDAEGYRFIQRDFLNDLGNRWIKARDISLITNRLFSINQNAKTVWRNNGKTKTKNIPLNIYVGANPRIKNGGSKKEDVSLARNLFVDLDKMTMVEALNILEKIGLPKPTMIINSGHGVHFYWRLDQPITDMAYWTQVQKHLIELFGSDPNIHDPSRVMRIPGFINVNGEHRLCEIYEMDRARLYPIEEFITGMPAVIAKSRLATTQVPNQTQISIRGQLSNDVLAYISKFEPKENLRHTTNFNRTCNLVEKFNLTKDQILPILREINSKSSNPLDDRELAIFVTKAENHVRKKGTVQGKKLIKYDEPKKEIVTLEFWREQIKEARLSSRGQVGQIYFDGSPCGAGKTTGDRVLIQLEKHCAILLPTHDACEEQVKELEQVGISAVAHPKLSAENCQKFGTEKKPDLAQLVQNAGLNVGRSVCKNCEHFSNCEYQKLRDQARNANVVLATHTRAQLSQFEPAKDKKLIFIHEDVTNLFRPKERIVRNSKNKDTPQCNHLRELLKILDEAKQIATSWQDQIGVRFCDGLNAAVEYLISELENGDIINELKQALLINKQSDNIPRVKLINSINTPEKYDYDHLLFRAMQRVGLYVNKTALSISLGFYFNEIANLAVVVDDVHEEGGNKGFVKSVLAVWKTEVPADSVLWIENASQTASEVERIIGRKVVDKTPDGRLENKSKIIQFPQDITMRTSANQVRSIVRALLARFVSAKKVGIITHSCHVAAINQLDDFWKKRIAKIEYFHSGKDRASNNWLDCDLILVLGTPRVSPAVVREHLITVGEIESAKFNKRFDKLYWEGKNESGEIVTVQGRGYYDEYWCEANNHFVKETLVQAIGRGRSVTEKGVDVVVVSNENLGMVLADSPLQPLSEQVDGTLHHILRKRLAARNAIYYTIGDVAANFTSDVIATISGKPIRTITSHFSQLITHGLVMRQGERSGYRLADWLLAYFVK